jgi:hypothetical protein
VLHLVKDGALQIDLDDPITKSMCIIPRGSGAWTDPRAEGRVPGEAREAEQAKT